ncbi:PAS domain-containing protein [Candidatus Woesearchaeota archaeon]|nr:PAS domain-containing protein [Candidatus Woesearchaeota archaeon]
MESNNLNLAKFNMAVLEGKATWWQMELPSGNVFFGDVKSKMLGYPESKFKKYTDFTNLLHPEDYDKAMNAMKEHLDGSKPLYDVIYRIRSKNGSYLTFYDCGKIIKKRGDNITLMGFVMSVGDLDNIDEQMKDFKDLILHGKPSIIDLISKIK